ncbi:MAG: hypothetical protein QOH65_1307 [Methylobacteriaceae bacterium]|jgi:hypothetical protein|nr:hypothetical protein [Methylobacteriaceae bacterium]
MRKDFQIALLCAVATVPASFAVSIAFEYFPYLKAHLGGAFYVNLFLALLLLGTASVIAIKGEREAERAGAKRRMVPLVGMIFFGTGFVLCAIWFFTSKPPEPSKEAQSNAPVEPGAKTPEEKRRVFVPPELTPERLLGFFEQNTTMQATELTKDRIGQWIRITEPLGNVGAFNGYFVHVSFEKSGRGSIYCLFRNPKDIDRLKILKQGDPISIEGQINRIEPYVLNLDNCEFAESAPR